MLSGMEFVGWHPMMIKDSGMFLSLALLDAGARLRKANGDDIELVGGLTEACRSLVDEEYVLDARSVPNSLRPWFNTSAQHITDRFGIDLWSTVIPLTPAPRYSIGGVAVDAEGRALVSEDLWLTGLYAAGASAASGMHGSDILAGNWTLDALLSGEGAGTSAGQWATSAKHGGQNLLMDAAFNSEAQIEAMSEVKDGMTVGAVTASIRRTMMAQMGLIREEKGLESVQTKIDDLAASPIRLSDDSQIMNMELIATLDASLMLDLAQAAISAAKARKESCGAHYLI
jgi:succinate dehydrogenase/fumarate reductase flavoprotein subunit